MMKEKLARRRCMKWLLIFGCWTLFGLFFLSQSYIQQAYAGRPFEWKRLLAVWMCSAYLWALLTPMVLYLARRFPIELKNWRRGFLFHLPASVLFSLVELLGFVLVTPLVGLPWMRQTFTSTYVAVFVIDFHWDLLTYWAILSITQVLDYYRKYQERKLLASRLETQLAQAQLGALKMQLHPHFLFNTLNAIVVLVRKESNREAAEMLTGLSELLRHVLEDTGKQEVTLKQEIEFLERYLEIEQVRFRDRLRVRLAVHEETLDALVPNLILQPLVENAIRHGIGKSATAGFIEIGARHDGRETLTIEIRDDGQGFAPDALDSKNLGIGIANTRARLRGLYGDDQKLEFRTGEMGGAVASLTIPFRLRRNASEG